MKDKDTNDDIPAITINAVNSIETVETLHATSLQSGKTVETTCINLFKMVTQSLEYAVKNSDKISTELFLEPIQKFFKPEAIAMFRRYRSEEWEVLSEMCDITLSPESSDCLSYSYSVYGWEYRLNVRFSSLSPTANQDEWCQLVLMIAVSHYNGHAERMIENTKQVNDSSYTWKNLVGNRIRTHLSKYTRLCRNSDTILLIGKTGTGKELVAKSLHELWNRKGKFIALNASAIPSDLIESELFGVKKGTATGVFERNGYFREAQSGTLFLDEISEIPLTLQAKLLRVLQEREYYPVGGTKAEKTDVKIVAATNHTAVMLLAGKMRPDLYFRLSQAVITLLPLKERKEDIASLCEWFLNSLEHQFNSGIRGISISALELLKTYNWPGNVRELENMLRQIYFNLPQGTLIQKNNLPEIMHEQEKENPAEQTLSQMIKDLEKKVIRKELECGKKIYEIAKSLGLSEGYLYRKIRSLGLNLKSD